MCDGCGRVDRVSKKEARKWRASRRAREITLAQMAKRLRCSVNFVHMIEVGKKPWPNGMRFRYLAALKHVTVDSGGHNGSR